MKKYVGSTHVVYICHDVIANEVMIKTDVVYSDLLYYWCYQVWVVSTAEPRLPLQIEDASRPDSIDVRITSHSPDT